MFVVAVSLLSSGRESDFRIAGPAATIEGRCAWCTIIFHPSLLFCRSLVSSLLCGPTAKPGESVRYPASGPEISPNKFAVKKSDAVFRFRRAHEWRGGRCRKLHCKVEGTDDSAAPLNVVQQEQRGSMCGSARQQAGEMKRGYATVSSPDPSSKVSASCDPPTVFAQVLIPVRYLAFGKSTSAHPWGSSWALLVSKKVCITLINTGDVATNGVTHILLLCNHQNTKTSHDHYHVS